MKSMTRHHWEDSLRFSRRDYLIVAACAGAALAMAVTSPPAAAARASGKAVAVCRSAEPEYEFIVIYDDYTFVGFHSESTMLAFLATCDDQTVVYAGSTSPTDPKDEASLFWYVFRGLRPRLTTCIISGGAEG